MYALVKTGGKQYRVSKDDTILVERLSAKEGEQIILSDIVMLGDGDKIIIGTPRVDGAGVSATVVRQTRGPKIIIFRRKRRKNHRRTQGHRQDLTLLKINEIAKNAKNLKTTKPAAKETSKRVAPPTAAAKKTLPKKTEPKAAAKKAVVKKADPKAAAKKAVTKKVEPKAVTKKAAAKKTVTKKVVTKKATSKN
jgi:large subunit ribosomal protein L21